MGRRPAIARRLLAAAAVAALLAALLAGGGCRQGPVRVGDMAFSPIPFASSTVYVSESGALVPYIVLTDNYNNSGKTLLLREHVMDEPRRYDENSQGNSYYAGSEIDEWLGSEYLSQLDGVEAVEAPIKISKRSALNHCGLEVEVIERKAFLLSWVEVGGPDGVTIAPDGEWLSYFMWHGAVATTADGAGCNYMLRSAMTCYNIKYSVAGSNGKFGGGGLEYESGVRPAFCVESDAEVEFVEDGELGRVPVLS